MKLRSGRQYKSDLSDVLGILAEHEKRGNLITIQHIQKAVTDLYGDWNALPEASRSFIYNVMQDGCFSKLYEQTIICEKETKELLIKFEQEHPGVTKEVNVNEIAGKLQKKSNRASVLAKLREIKQGTEQ